MFWLIGIAVFIFFILSLFLLSRLIIEVDTRVPQAGIRWGALGKARIWYDNEWWLSLQLLFYRKTIRVAGIKSKPVKKEPGKKKPKKGIRAKTFFKKIVPLIKICKVIEWRLAIDTGDNFYNAQLFSLNIHPKTFNHLFINFNDENFLVLKIGAYPWKILYNFLR